MVRCEQGRACSAHHRAAPALTRRRRRPPAGFQHVPREEKQTLVGQVFHSVANSYDLMNDLMSGGWVLG